MWRKIPQKKRGLNIRKTSRQKPTVVKIYLLKLFLSVPERKGKKFSLPPHREENIAK